jgi:hypothetical protein
MQNILQEKDGKSIMCIMDFHLELTNYVSQILLLDFGCCRKHTQVDRWGILEEIKPMRCWPTTSIGPK